MMSWISRRLAALVTVLSFAGPAIAQTAPPVPPAPPLPARPIAVTPAARARALEISQVLNNEAATLRIIRTGLERDMPKVLAKDPNFQMLEKAYPGISKFTIAAMYPVMEEFCRLRLPDLWSRTADVYAEQMTENELAVALAFYSSPTGGWLIEQIVAGTDLSSVMALSMADPDRLVTAADLKDASSAETTAKLVKGMTPERAREILRFGMSSAGRKARLLQPRLLQVGADWANQTPPELDKKMEAEVTKAMTAFIEQSDRAAPSTGADRPGPTT